MVGGARGRVLEAVDLLQGHPDAGPQLTITGDRLTVGDGNRAHAAIWLVAFDHHDVAIARGENRGRTVRYHHLVRELNRLTDRHGRALEIVLPLAALDAAGRTGAAILAQRLSDGVILAAARIDRCAGCGCQSTGLVQS